MTFSSRRRTNYAFTLYFAMFVVHENAHGFEGIHHLIGSERLFRSHRASSRINSRSPETNDLDKSLLAVQELSETCIRRRGKFEGYDALSRLGELASQRVPYDFEDSSYVISQKVISFQEQLLSSSVTDAFLNEMRIVEQNGGLHTNLDSVDNLPSLHVNLVVNGDPPTAENEHGLQDNMQAVFSLVKSPLYEELLPRVQELVGRPVCIDEVFIRRYGDDVGRTSISAHFDALSIATAVVALDDSAANGTNGLFTTSTSASSHSALRRFFPLQRGDAVVHTWDVLHGVDVEPEFQRTSLIVWFAAVPQAGEEEKFSPWIVDRVEPSSARSTDGTAEFVLASAIESAILSGEENHQEHPHDLYLESASSGNAFAMGRLGSLSSTDNLTPERVMNAFSIVRKLRPSWEEYPFPISHEDKSSALAFEKSTSCTFLAKLLWFEGSLRGLSSSQLSLGYALMEHEAFASSQDLRLLAAVLFNLAYQQGTDEAFDYYTEVVKVEIASLSIESNEEFLASPVVKTINSW